MPRGLPWQLRKLVIQVQEELATRKGNYPETTDALTRLESALALEFPPKAKPEAKATKRSRMRVMIPTSKDAKLWKRQLKRKNEKLEQLQTQNAKLLDAKHKGGVISGDWIVRVALANPHASARALEACFRDICGVDRNVIGRTAMGRIKDAFVEVVKEMHMNQAKKMVANACSAALAANTEFVSLHVIDIFDGADLRLRSVKDREDKVPARSRSSKVQQHVVNIVVNGQQLEIPTELEALSDKTAATLTTSLERVLRTISAQVLPGIQEPMDIALWICMVLVGDAIPTNEAAAKGLWSAIAETPLGGRSRFFLAMFKCLVHQAALTTKSAVCGPAAALGDTTGKALHETLPGVMVRLYKYLLCDYYEEFVQSTREWVLRSLQLVPHGSSSADGQRQVAQMRALYGDHVISDECLRLFNNGLNLSHIVEDGIDMGETRAQLVGMFVAYIVKSLFHVDSHPVSSRFFTFRDCIDHGLTMALLDIPRNAFVLKSVNPRKVNQARLRKVQTFFQKTESAPLLRRTSLALRLTGVMTVMASTHDTEDVEPMIVRVCKGEMHALLQQRKESIVGAMHGDASLDIAATITLLFATEADLILRLAPNQGYPNKVCFLCKRSQS